MKTIKERAAKYVVTYIATNYETYAEKDDIALAYEAGANEVISIFNKMIESSESLENIKNVIHGLVKN